MKRTDVPDDVIAALVRVKIELEDELGKRRRDPLTPSAYVRWSRLDRIADALRETGLELDAPLGTAYGLELRRRYLERETVR